MKYFTSILFIVFVVIMSCDEYHAVKMEVQYENGDILFRPAGEKINTVLQHARLTIYSLDEKNGKNESLPIPKLGKGYFLPSTIVKNDAWLSLKQIALGNEDLIQAGRVISISIFIPPREGCSITIRILSDGYEVVSDKAP